LEGVGVAGVGCGGGAEGADAGGGGFGAVYLGSGGVRVPCECDVVEGNGGGGNPVFVREEASGADLVVFFVEVFCCVGEFVAVCVEVAACLTPVLLALFAGGKSSVVGVHTGPLFPGGVQMGCGLKVRCGGECFFVAMRGPGRLRPVRRPVLL